SSLDQSDAGAPNFLRGTVSVFGNSFRGGSESTCESDLTLALVVAVGLGRDDGRPGLSPERCVRARPCCGVSMGPARASARPVQGAAASMAPSGRRARGGGWHPCRAIQWPAAGIASTSVEIDASAAGLRQVLCSGPSSKGRVPPAEELRHEASDRRSDRFCCVLAQRSQRCREPTPTNCATVPSFDSIRLLYCERRPTV